MHIEENNLEFDFGYAPPIIPRKKNTGMKTFKLTPEQKLKLLELGYTQKDCEAMVLADIPNAKTLKICFSETEVLEWLNKKYPRCLTVDEVFSWWWSYCKPEYKNVHGGLYAEYLKRHAKRKPLVMYKEMAVDNKPHKVY